MSSTPADDPEIAAAIARAEARRAVLERVTEVTMALLEEAAKVEPASGPKALGAAVKEVAQLSRAVRLTLAQETRLDELILALRKGDIPKLSGAGRRAAAKADPLASDAPSDAYCPFRDRVETAVWGAIERTVDDKEEALHSFDRLHERLYESREYDRFDFKALEAATRSICADLGVEPDWALWDEPRGGFPILTGRPLWRETWHRTFAERKPRHPEDPPRPETAPALARAGPFKRE